MRTPLIIASLLLSAPALVACGTESTDGTLDLPAEALLRLVYGRLDADHTPTLGLSARDVTLDDLRAIFPGF